MGNSDDILGALSFRAKRSGARNLLFVAALGRAVCHQLSRLMFRMSAAGKFTQKGETFVP